MAPVFFSRKGYRSRRAVAAFALFAISSSFAGDPIPRKPWNPFRPLFAAGFGNLPQSPNPLFGNSMHLMAVDLFQEAGTPVYSVHSGTARFPKIHRVNDWTTTIQVMGDDGVLTYYMHLDPATISEELRAGLAAPGGIEISSGTLLGRLIGGPGRRNPHLHFGAVNCRKGIRLNPLQFLDFSDTQPPRITKISAELKGREVVGQLTGSVDLRVYSADLIDGMSGVFPPNRIEFSIRSVGANKPILTSILFDATQFPFMDAADPRMGEKNCANFHAFDGYAPALGNLLYAEYDGIRTSKNQEFKFALSADVSTLTSLEQKWFRPINRAWDTAETDPSGKPRFPDGEYLVEVIATDIRGNLTRRHQSFSVENTRISKTRR